MNNQIASSQLFQRKISEFCQIRVAPITSQHAFENIRSYMLHLITSRTAPPAKLGRPDWQEIAATCDLREDLTPTLKRGIQPGLDAIVRWLRESPADDVRESGRRALRPGTSGKQALDSAATGIGIVDPIALDHGSPGLIKRRLVIGGIFAGRKIRTISTVGQDGGFVDDKNSIATVHLLRFQGTAYHVGVAP